MIEFSEVTTSNAIERAGGAAPTLSVPLHSARAYGTTPSLAGRDLATWTQWPGADPEITSTRRGALTRNDAAALPFTRRISLGVQVDFNRRRWQAIASRPSRRLTSRSG